MKVIMTKFFGLDEPGNPHYICRHPSGEPQTVLRKFGEAAIAAGCAVEHKPKKPLKGENNDES